MFCVCVISCNSHLLLMTLVIRKNDHSEVVSIDCPFVKEVSVEWPHCLALLPSTLTLQHSPSPAPARLSRFTRCSVGRLSPSDSHVPTGCGGVMPHIPTRADPSLCLRPKHLEHCLGTHGPSVNICWTNKWTSVTPALNWKHPKSSGKGRAVFTHLC